LETTLSKHSLEKGKDVTFIQKMNHEK